MDKTWLGLVVIGLIEVAAFVGYQFYLSVTGQNVEFEKKIEETELVPDLGVEQLVQLEELQNNVLVKDSELDVN